MRVRWTAEAQSDLVRLFEFLAPVNSTAKRRREQFSRCGRSRQGNCGTIPALGHAWTTLQIARFDACSWAITSSATKFAAR